MVKFGEPGTPSPKPNFVKKNRLTGIPLLGKLILKVTNFGDFGGCKQHFKNDNGELWREGTDLIVGYIILLVFIKSAFERASRHNIKITTQPSNAPNFVKIAQGICPWENFYQNFRDFLLLKPTFLNP